MYAFNLYEARKSHFEKGLFDKIPKKLNIMEEEQMNDRYITQPNLQEFVFVRMLVDIEEWHYDQNITAKIVANSVYFMPFVKAKEFLTDGRAELL